MKFVLGTVLATCMIAAQALAGGVEFHLESKSPSGSPEITKVHTDGNNLKMSMSSEKGREDQDMIFRNQSREMVVVDNSQRTYTVLDMETIKSMAGTVNSAMAQMEEALKNVPEAQRAMMEKMLKKRMPQAQTVEIPEIKVRKTSKKANKAGYACVRYDVLENGKKIREMWITPWSKVEGGAEVANAFSGMGEFFEELINAFNMPSIQESMQQMKRNMFAQMKEMEGFPVVTLDFNEDGSLERETVLKSATKRSLSAADFEPPKGYKRQTMMDGR